DFLQLPAVLNPDVYVNNNGLGYRLWRSLNGVVILTQQMRQARDPSYAALLSRCQVRKPTDDDIEKLRDRIGAKLPNMRSAAVTVLHHIDRVIDLVNGKIVNFVGFADSEGNQPNGQIIIPPAYMLVKMPGKEFRLGHFPVSVFPLDLSTLTGNCLNVACRIRER